MKRFILLSCYQNYKLTGAFKDSVASTVGYLPFDFRNQRWAENKSFQWKTMPVTFDMLPTLVEAGEVLGHVTSQRVWQLEFPEGIRSSHQVPIKLVKFLELDVLTTQWQI